MMEEEQHTATDLTPPRQQPKQEVKTVRHVHGIGHADFVRQWLAKHRPQVQLDDRVAKGVAVQARIDHGRWLTDCPYCPGAELVDLEDLRFYCLSCDNAGANGRWLVVVLPPEEERQAIEKAVLERPPQFRHWRPEQTLVDVQTENVLHPHW